MKHLAPRRRLASWIRFDWRRVRGFARHESTATLALYLALLGVLLIPVWQFRYPPLLDYPNHLARAFVLLHPDNELLGRYYQAAWSLLPNLGMDLAMLGLGQIFSIHTAGKAFISLTLLLMTSAPLALSYALRGKIHSINLMPLVFTYSLVTQYGFLSYLLSTSLAIWFYALYHACSSRRPFLAIGIGVAFATILSIAHLYGLLIYGALVLGHAGSSFFSSGGRLFAKLRLLFLRGLQGAIPLAMLSFWGPPSEGGSAVWASVSDKILLHATLLSSYPMLAKVAILALLASVALLYGSRRQWPLVGSMTAPVLVLYALYWVAPQGYGSGWHGDWRLLPAVALAAAGALTVGAIGPWNRLAIGIAISALAGFQSWYLQERWRRADAIQSRVAAYLASVEPGAGVLPLFLGNSIMEAQGPIPYTHLAATGVIENCTFIPSLFAYRSQQPLRYTDAYEKARTGYAQVFFLDPSIVDWTRAEAIFDYILVLDADGGVENWQTQIPIPTIRRQSDGAHIMLLRTSRQAPQRPPPAEACPPADP